MPMTHPFGPQYVSPRRRREAALREFDRQQRIKAIKDWSLCAAYTFGVCTLLYVGYLRLTA